MKSDLGRPVLTSRWRRCVLGMAAGAVLAAGCAAPHASTAETSRHHAEHHTAPAAAADVVAKWMRFQEAALRRPMAERLAEESALARETVTPFNLLQRGLLLSGSQDHQALLRAHTVLDHAVLLLEDPVLKGVAQLLSEQVRLRLEATARLIDLEAKVESQQKQLNDSRLEQQRLRAKIDALAEIERSLPVAPQPDGQGDPGSQP